jgi:MFS family permease
MLTREAVLSCIAAFCITMSCGFMNSWGVGVTYITSHLRSYDGSVTVNKVNFVLALYSVLNGLGLVVSVWLVSKVGPQRTNFIGTGSVVLGLCLTAVLTGVWSFVVVFGVLAGLGTGISVMTGTNVAVLHFTQNRGKAVGFCASGIAFGSVVFGLLFTYIVNPHNSLPDIQSQEGAQTVYYFGPDVSNRVPIAILASALVVLCLGVTGSLLMRVKEVPAVQFTDSNEEDMLSHKGEDEEPLTLSQALRQPKFWKTFGVLYCSMSMCVWVFTSYKSFGSLYIHDDHFLSYVGATGAVLNGVGRLVFPFLLDYVNFSTLNKCALGLEVVLAFSISYAVQSKLAYITVVSAVFVIQSALYFPLSLFCLQEYGPALGPKVFSYVAQGSTIACAMPGVYYWLVVRHFGYYMSFFIQGLQVLFGLLLAVSSTATKPLKEVSSKQSFAN